MTESAPSIPEQSLLRLEYHKVLRRIADYALSEQGRKEVMSLRPAWDEEVSKRFQAETETASTLLENGIRPPSQGIDALHEVIVALDEGTIVLSPVQLRFIGTALSVMEGFHASVETLDLESSRLEPLENCINEIPRLVALSNRLISLTTPEGELASDASPEISRLARRVESLKRKLSRRIEKLSASYCRKGVIRDSPHTVRDGRYVLPVISSRKKDVRGIIHDRSETGETVFIEPSELVEEGNALREAVIDLDFEKRKILREASISVRGHLDELKAGYGSASKLDAIFARAAFSSEMNTIFPSTGPLNLGGLGHPLIPADELVRNDVSLPAHWRVLIVSGPNAGGKSVLLKSLGLAVTCSQSGIGAFVSAGSTIPFFRRIHVSIGDQQSIADHLSTYSARLEEQLDMLRNLGRDGLALIDEPAAGTDPLTGTALAASLLENLASEGCRLVVTTHHGQLKSLAQGREGFVNGCMNFHSDTLEPSYTFTGGIPGSSFTLEIARKMNFPEHVLNRAQELSGDSFRLDRMLEEITDLRNRSEEKLSLLLEREAEGRTERQRLEEKLRSDIQRVDEARIRQEKESSEEKVRISSRADSLLAKLARSSDPLDRKALRSEIRELTEAEQQDELEVLSINESGGDILLGSWVNVDGWKGPGLVEELSKDHAVVLMGSLRLRKPLCELSIAPSPEKKGDVAQWNVPAHARVELDLRGMSSDEAVSELDSALDDSIVAGMPQLRVIHGKGKGILMRSVVDMVRNDHRVASFRQGRPSEGGTGVTIILINLSGKKKNG